MTTTRGTTNGNVRGSSYARRARRAWLIANYASDQPSFCRCYRCGILLYNPDDPPTMLFGKAGDIDPVNGEVLVALLPTETSPYFMPGRARHVTVDRIIPGCQGGTYRRNNIRPACGPCNSETGGSTRRKRPTP